MQRQIFDERSAIRFPRVPELVEVVDPLGVVRDHEAPDLDGIAKQELAIVAEAGFALEYR